MPDAAPPAALPAAVRNGAVLLGPAPSVTEPPQHPTLDRLRSIAGVVAPGTVIAAVMYYYGYVTSYARFAYFGVDLSTLHMGTQDLALQSVAALYVPVAALLGAGLLGYLTHVGVTRLLLSGRWPTLLRRAGRVVVAIGILLLARAVWGILSPDLAASEPIATTPAALGLGPLLIGWGRHVSAGTPPARPAGGVPRVGWLFVAGIGVLSLFWVTNSVASAYGTGQADLMSRHLDERPAVTLDTTERLYTLSPGVDETALPAEPDQKFRYRYTGMRLLVESDGTLFLVPLRWREGGDVLVLPRDDGVRLAFSP